MLSPGLRFFHKGELAGSQEARLYPSGGRQWRLEDLIGDGTYERVGSDLQARGLYLDEPPWRARVFSMTPAPVGIINNLVKQSATGVISDGA